MGTSLLSCFSVVVLLLIILDGGVFPTSFQLSPSPSSSEDKMASSPPSVPAVPAPVVGGVMSSINQSW